MVGMRHTSSATRAVMLTGVYHCMKAEIPLMLEGGGGAIVNTASGVGLVGYPQQAAYTASKHGVIGLTKVAALDYGSQGVRVNAIAPGIFPTALNRELLESARGDELLMRTPMGRFGQVDEIVGAAVYLCSDAASFTTGQILVVDGGQLASGVNQ